MFNDLQGLQDEQFPVLASSFPLAPEKTRQWRLALSFLEEMCELQIHLQLGDEQLWEGTDPPFSLEDREAKDLKSISPLIFHPSRSSARETIAPHRQDRSGATQSTAKDAGCMIQRTPPLTAGSSLYYSKKGSDFGQLSELLNNILVSSNEL